ncbi:MAG: hypothetical protein OES46_11190 [Gammaproteobacteria bacterium]|nr:hypothetical protein [Gammaproteobacteria bacterium]
MKASRKEKEAIVQFLTNLKGRHGAQKWENWPKTRPLSSHTP